VHVSASDPAVGAPARARGLGTFGGVFTPSVLTILGVIMFLRFGFVTGNAGLDRTLLIVLIANAVSVLTSLSLAVIATNTRVQGGGDYYLISRSLGLEFGGAIGMVLFLAQSISVGFYVVGFTEALIQVVGGVSIPARVFGVEVPPALVGLDPDTVSRLISTAACLVLFVVAYRGADVATRLQYVIMLALAAALVSFFWGASRSFDPELLADNRGAAPGGLPFWVLFAIFFPAITGFTQGVSMSGDLKDPAKSLPRGTFLAVGVSLLVYLALPLFLAGTTDRGHLLSDPGALSLKRVATVPGLIDAGVYAATLSSALASFMGAPRILRAMSRDGLVPGSRYFAQTNPLHTEPRRAITLTLAIALVCIWAGDLNALATVVTMFFLLSYGALNYATFVEGFSRSPSFRPRFRLSGWRTSLVGALVCGGVMLAIDPFATGAAVVVLGGIHRYLRSRELESPAGDARYGYYVQRIKEYLLKLRERPPHARDWRPAVVGATRRGEDGRALERFARAIGSEHGILTVAVVLVGRFRTLVAERERQVAELERLVRSEGTRPFFAVTIAETYAQGIRSLLMGHGIGRLRPNTLLLYWSMDLQDEYLEILESATSIQFNVVLLHAQPMTCPFAPDPVARIPGTQRRVDVWWRGAENGSFALVLANLVRETREWRGCEIRLLRIVREQAEMEAAERELVGLVQSSRISAKVTIVRSGDPPFDVIAQESRDSHLVFLGVGGVVEGRRTDLARYNDLLARLPTTVLVNAWTMVDVAV
jgi:amino acid transporter